MLILAGVAVIALTGKNGNILARAAEAKEEKELANIKEEIQVDLLTEQIRKTEDMDLTENEINAVLGNGSYVAKLEQIDGNYITTDKNGVWGINITTSGTIKR